MADRKQPRDGSRSGPERPSALYHEAAPATRARTPGSPTASPASSLATKPNLHWRGTSAARTGSVVCGRHAEHASYFPAHLGFPCGTQLLLDPQEAALSTAPSSSLVDPALRWHLARGSDGHHPARVGSERERLSAAVEVDETLVGGVEHVGKAGAEPASQSS
jgi:hypothetical protein